MDKNNTTISISIPNPIVGIEKIKSAILNSSVNFYNGPVRNTAGNSRNIFKSIKNIKNPFKGFKIPRFDKNFLLRLALPVFIVLIFILAGVGLIRNFNTTQGLKNTNEEISIPLAVSFQELNKKISFPLRDGEGKEVGNYDFIIQNAELRKQIIVKGQRATAVEGRVFLILNLKLTNNLSQEIEIPTRNYLRVIVNGNNEELLAPDIHNDPVEVLGKSTKYTRLGLAVNESDAKKTIKLLVGEVDGDKQTIELNFK